MNKHVSSRGRDEGAPSVPSEVHFGFINFGTREDPRILLVKDADKGRPPLWKLVGGRGEDFDIPLSDNCFAENAKNEEERYLAAIAKSGSSSWVRELLPRFLTSGQRTIVREVYEEVGLHVFPARTIVDVVFEYHREKKHPDDAQEVVFVHWVAWELSLLHGHGTKDIRLGAEIALAGTFLTEELDLLIYNQEVVRAKNGSAISHDRAIDIYLHAEDFLNLPRT